jgi:hypothetical protein
MVRNVKGLNGALLHCTKLPQILFVLSDLYFCFFWADSVVFVAFILKNPVKNRPDLVSSAVPFLLHVFYICPYKYVSDHSYS